MGPDDARTALPNGYSRFTSIQIWQYCVRMGGQRMSVPPILETPLRFLPKRPCSNSNLSV